MPDDYEREHRESQVGKLVLANIGVNMQTRRDEGGWLHIYIQHAPSEAAIDYVVYPSGTIIDRRTSSQVLFDG